MADGPPREGSRIQHGRQTSVWWGIRQLLAKSLDDPDRLAVACAVWTLAGYAPMWLVDELVLASGSGDVSAAKLSDDDARDFIETALWRRNRRVLRNRAEGALQALEVLAQDAEAADLHRTHVESCVIECRELPIEERLEHLRRGDPEALVGG